MLVLWKSKKIMARVTSTIKHRNWYAIVERYNDIIFVVKLLVAEKVFEKTLGCDLGDNAESTNTDLFHKGTAVLVGAFFAKLYLSSTRKLDTSWGISCRG